MAEVEYAEPVIARIWGAVEPIDRGEQYEDPLEAVLAEHALGTITGGGSQLSEKFEIVFADIELQLANREEALELARKTLDELGAPVGSELLLDDNGKDVVVPFGTQEGVAVYLDGLTLPQQVYEDYDINELADRMTDALTSAEAGAIRGSWAGPEETAIYVYGKSAEGIFAALKPILSSYPLCQNSRVVLRCGNPKLGPREIRLPRLA
jgi:hypothetical protein